MSDMGTVYAEGRTRVTDLVNGLDESQHQAAVPTCPQWTVHDVLAHLTGVCADILAGNLEGVATDPWTEAQVDKRRGVPVPELLGEWTELGPHVEAIAAAFPGRAAEQLVFDLTTHEHDIRTAVGLPGARESAGIHVGVDFGVTAALPTSLNDRGLAPLRVHAGDQQLVSGEGEPGATVATSAFELFRALTGRRSAAQIRAYEWTGEPGPYIAAFTFGPFTVSPTDIAE
jgi:uncharacterized protein (TIGR03083 family)